MQPLLRNVSYGFGVYGRCVVGQLLGAPNSGVSAAVVLNVCALVEVRSFAQNTLANEWSGSQVREG